MNTIRKEIYEPLNEEFSSYISKYGTKRIDFMCTVSGLYAWYYSDDELLGNIPGFSRCKGTRKDRHRRVRSYEERVKLEQETQNRYSFYLIELDQVDKFAEKLREILSKNL